MVMGELTQETELLVIGSGPGGICRCVSGSGPGNGCDHGRYGPASRRRVFV